MSRRGIAEAGPERKGAPAELLIRTAEPGDGDAIAGVYLAARARMIYIPPRPEFEPERVRAWIAAHLLAEAQVFVALLHEQISGFLAVAGSDLLQLYVRPELTGRAIGKALLDHAKAISPAGLSLWVLEENTAAIRFYEREGFLTAERTDGATSMEGIPDRRMVWELS